MSAANIKAGMAYIELTVENNAMVRGLKAAQAKLKAFSDSITAAGKKLLLIGSLIALPFAAGVSAYADFEKQMANVSTMLDEPAKYMDEYRKSIREMSIEFGEGTDTLSKGLYDILSASVDPAKALDVLAVSAKAAKGGMTDTGIAADSITTILNAFGLSADHATSVSDLLFAVVRRGKTTFAELAPAIGLVATTAATAGVNLEEFGAAIATMTRHGVRTENAITALNAIISTFLKPSDEAAAYAKKLGFEMSSAAIKSEGLAGVFEKIKKLSPDDIATLFPNVRAIRGILPALKNMEGFNYDMEVMRKRTGMAEVAYQKMAATLAESMARLKQAGIQVLAVIGEALAPMIKEKTDLLLSYMKQIIQWIGEHRQVIITIAKIGVAAIAAGALLMGFGMTLKVAAVAAGLLGGILKTVLFVVVGGSKILWLLMAPLSMIKTGIIALGGVLGALLTPVVLVKLAIVGIVAYLLYATGVIGQVVDWLKEKFAAVSEFAQQSFQGIKDTLAAGDMMLAAKIFWQSLKVAWLAGINELKLLWVTFKKWYQTVTSETFYGAISIITDAWASLKTVWTNTVSFLLDIWNMFIKSLKSAWITSQAFLQKCWLDFMGMIDPIIDVEAAKKLVDDETAMKEKGAQGELNNKLKESAAASNQDKAAIEKERADKQTIIAQQQEADRAGIDAEASDALKASMDALKQAKDEWKKSIDEAKAKKESGEKQSDKIGELQDRIKNAAPEVAAAQGKTEVGGTFYADALKALSSGNAAERTATATEEIKKNTKKTNQLLENNSGGLAYE